MVSEITLSALLAKTCFREGLLRTIRGQRTNSFNPDVFMRTWLAQYSLNHGPDAISPDSLNKVLDLAKKMYVTEVAVNGLADSVSVDKDGVYCWTNPAPAEEIRISWSQPLFSPQFSLWRVPGDYFYEDPNRQKTARELYLETYY